MKTRERITQEAEQLSTAIQRVQSEDEVRRANDELEQRFEQRTAELASANQKLQFEIAERERAEEELRSSEKELLLLACARYPRIPTHSWPALEEEDYSQAPPAHWDC